jgi:hypothetical protein
MLFFPINLNAISAASLLISKAGREIAVIDGFNIPDVFRLDK